MKVRITQLTSYGMDSGLPMVPVVGRVYEAEFATGSYNAAGDIDLVEADGVLPYTIAACDYEVVEG